MKALRLTRLITALALVGALSSQLSAASDAGPDAPEVTAPADSAQAPAAVAPPAAKPAEAPAAAAATEPAPSVGELLGQVGELKQELDAYRDMEDGKAKRLALFGLLAAVTWFLIGALRWYDVITDVGAKYIPIGLAAMGVAAALFTRLAGGASWADAVIVGAGPPLAVFLHELKKRFASS